MGDWSDILREVKETSSQFDFIRHKYLKNLKNLADLTIMHL